MGAQRARYVHHRDPEGRAVALARRVKLAGDVQIRAAHVAVDQEGEIRRVDPALEVGLVDLHEVVVTLLGALQRGDVVNRTDIIGMVRDSSVGICGSPIQDLLARFDCEKSIDQYEFLFGQKFFNNLRKVDCE